MTNFTNSSFTGDLVEPFYKHPVVEFSILFLKCFLISVGIVANFGVVLTALFHKCPRKHAALAAASLCVSNIFYGFFILFFATPLRYSDSFKQTAVKWPVYCHATQIGSNAPKTWIIAHHVWIAVDTFWLIKRPFQYSSLINKYFKTIFLVIWIGLTFFEICFQSLTLCFYETFYRGVYGPSNPPTSMIPEITNILTSFTLYIGAFLAVVVLYFEVFKEALNRTRGDRGKVGGTRGVERESLTSDGVAECNDDTYKRELRLLYGFVALITGTIFFIIFRNLYYGLCLYIGCSAHRERNDFLVSTITSLMLSLLLVIAPYTYFYRNPLFWKCFLKYLSKACPSLMSRYIANEIAQRQVTLAQINNGKKADTSKTDETKV